jgi:hypothetical protein
MIILSWLRDVSEFCLFIFSIFLLRYAVLGYKQKPRSHYRSPRQVQAARTRHARRIDEALKAPRAKTPEQWMRQPNRFDLPDIDTPKQSDKQQEEQHQETAKAFEPKPLTHSQIKQRLAVHRLYGNTH